MLKLAVPTFCQAATGLRIRKQAVVGNSYLGFILLVVNQIPRWAGEPTELISREFRDDEHAFVLQFSESPRDFLSGLFGHQIEGMGQVITPMRDFWHCLQHGLDLVP